MDRPSTAARDDVHVASAQPLSQTACPLCGGPNGCAPAATGSFDTPCWCRDARFTPALLARVRARGGRGCVCARCAAGAFTAEGGAEGDGTP